jgi:hypothetical protein
MRLSVTSLLPEPARVYRTSAFLPGIHFTGNGVNRDFQKDL